MATAAWLAPLIGTLGGSALQSRGSKKAAKGAKPPQIPEAFAGPVGQAAGLLDSRLGGGFQPFPGGALNPLQSMAMGQMGSSFGAGQAGLASAQNTIESLAATGIDPAAINTASSQLAPYFDALRERGLGQVREAQGQRGGFFGTGGIGGESDYMNQFAGMQAAQTLPLAMQMSGLRLGAAQALPGFLAGQQGLGMNLFNVGGQAQAQQLAEFLRQQPENAIPMLAQLMGGTPMYQPPVAQNFGQVAGANVGSALGSTGFWDYLRSLGGGGTGSSVYGPPAPFHVGQNVGPG